MTSITTDHPIAVRIADGTRIIGMVSPAPEGGDQDRRPDQLARHTVDKVEASWAAGEEDPDVVALRRKWSYEAGVDINGSSGTHTQLGTAATFRAKLTGPDDTFQYYANYNCGRRPTARSRPTSSRRAWTTRTTSRRHRPGTRATRAASTG